MLLKDSAPTIRRHVRHKEEEHEGIQEYTRGTCARRDDLACQRPVAHAAGLLGFGSPRIENTGAPTEGSRATSATAGAEPIDAPQATAMGEDGVSVTDAAIVHRFSSGHPDGIARVDGVYWVAMTSGDRLDALAPEQGVVAQLSLPRGCLPTGVCLARDGRSLLVTAGFAEALLRVPFPGES